VEDSDVFGQSFPFYQSLSVRGKKLKSTTSLVPPKKNVFVTLLLLTRDLSRFLMLHWLGDKHS